LWSWMDANFTPFLELKNGQWSLGAGGSLVAGGGHWEQGSPEKYSFTLV
jgi:hypothetical protein